MKRRAVRIRKYLVSAYQRTALHSLMPPDDLSVSEWAEQYRILDSKSSALPGPWQNDKTPYLVGIMDEMTNCDTEEIALCKGTQLGGTEVILNTIGYIIQQDPSPTLIVYPSDILAESISKNRLEPMILASPALKKRYGKADSTRLELQFDGMYLSLVGSNSPANLSSKAVRFLFLDEVDKYQGASKKESDPISLARERTKTFHNRKIFLTSTPTLRNGPIWKALEGCDVIKHYFVPCPHCGEYIELDFKQLKFSKDKTLNNADRAANAYYRCQICGGAIFDRHKPEMLRRGQWRTVKEKTKFARKVGFWIHTLYSPFVRFSEMAKEWLDSQEDPEKLQNFVNSWLAEPWEDTQVKTSADLVLERQTALPELVVPAWARVLTAGVDVQETCVYWTIRAWGSHLTSQNIAHGQAVSFAEIERIMNLQYIQEETGNPFVVELALIDSGDNTDLVYDFCANNSDWAMPSKGASHPMDTHFRRSVVNRTSSTSGETCGTPLVLIDTGKYKDMIAGRMRKENGTGSWMVYAGCDRTYAEQVTAEHKVNVKTAGGRTVQRWVPKTSHRDNHYLDCEVYSMCAAEMMGARTFHLQEIEARPRAEAKPEPAPTPEIDWIQEYENWL